jgi:Condensation domain/Phosphopantetheine attachment site
VTAEELSRLAAAEWKRELGCPVPEDGHFFRLGGTSLGAARVLSRLRLALGLRLSLSALLDHPQFIDFTAFLETSREALPDAALPDPIDRDGPLPMAFLQEYRVLREVLAHRDGKAHPRDFIPVAVSIDSAASDAEIHTALRAIVARHESLRLGFAIDPEANRAHTLLADEPEIHLPIRRCGDADPQRQDAFVCAQYAALTADPLELDRPPLWRACLCRLGPAKRILLLAVDHVIMDGQSVHVLVRDLARALEHRLPTGPRATRLDYLDWAQWQRTGPGGTGRHTIIDFWRKELADTGAFPRLAMPAPEPTGASFHLSIRTLDARRATALRSGPGGATPLSAFLAAIGQAWRRVHGATDIVVHTPTANRGDPRLEDLVGNFAHALPIRLVLPEDPAGAVSAAAGALSRALSHQELPLSEFTVALAPDVLRVAPLPPRLFAGLDLTAAQPISAPGGQLRVIPLPTAADTPVARAGLGFFGQAVGDGLELSVLGDPRETAPAFIAAIADRTAEALTAIVDSCCR